MAVTGKLISQLTGEVTQPTGEEYMLVENGGTSKKMKSGIFLDKINKLENKVFPLSVTVSGGGVFEKGISKDITVSWTVKKGSEVITADSITVNGEAATGTNKVFSGVTATTTYTVKATKDGMSAQGSTTATFVAPMYFGFAESSNADGLDIVSLNKQTIKTSPNGTYSLNNATTGHYLWLCVPQSMTINKVTSGGFDVPMEAAQTKATSVDTYKCYRSTNAINAGAMNIVIS